MDFLFWPVTLPLLWYVFICVMSLAALLWFGVLKKRVERKAGGWTEEDCLSQLKELSHDYATLGLMAEDHHQSLVDIQKELFQLDERLSKLEIRSTTIRIGLSQIPWSQEAADYVGPDDEDLDDDGYGNEGDVLTLPTPLPDWLDLVEERLKEL